MEIRGWRKLCKEGRNGGELLRRLKPTVGCNASRRRRSRRRRRRRRRRNVLTSFRVQATYCSLPAVKAAGI
jgi:hypothetical protein